MKMTIKTLLLLLPLLQLTGCGGGQSSAKLEISKAFSVTNPYFGGGLIVYGENTQGKQFSFALDSSLQKSVPLDNGTWTFYAIGWDGDTSGNKKFGGVTYCGQKEIAISQDSTVSIDVTTDCSSLVTNLNLQPLKVSTCGAFYNYDQGQNTFSSVTSATPSNFCQNLPLDLRSPYTHGKIVALEKINNNIVPKFQSACFALDGATAYASVPGKKIPLEIKTFRNLEECQGSTAKFQNFTFAKGIASGSSIFDHIHFIAADQRLILASGITRRGFSPLMSNAPRILCGTPGLHIDCMPDETSGTHINVDWFPHFNNSNNFNERKYTVLKNVGNLSCPVTSTSTKFGFKNCEVNDNQLKVHLYRNAFVCHESTSFQYVVDLYARNDKLYVLKNNAGSASLSVYDKTGLNLYSTELPTDAKDVAVTTDDVVLVSHPTGVDRYDYKLSYVSTIPISLTTEVIQELEVSDSPNLFYISTYDGASTYELRSYNLDGSGLQTRTISSSGETTKIQFYNGYAYVRQIGSSNIYKMPLLGDGHVDSVTTIQYLTIDPSVSSFHIDNDRYYLNFVDKVYEMDLTTQVGTVGLGIGRAFVSMDNKLYAISGSNLNVYNLSQTGTHTADVKETSGMCEEDVTFTAGSLSKTLNLMTKVNSIYPIFAETFNIIGRQFFTLEEQASYLFDQHHDEDVKVSGGGILNDAFKDLSPAGIAGLIPRSLGATCSEVLNYVTVNGQFTDTETVFDPFKNESISAQITVKSISETINMYFCHPTDIGGASCTTDAKYTLQVDYNVSSSQWNDKGRFKVACGGISGNSGSFERYEVEDDGSYRKLILWQTTLQNASRFEEYKFEKGINNKVYGEVSKFQKTTDDNFWSRRVGLHSDNNGASGWSSQIERTGSELYTKNVHLSEATFGAFFSADYEVFPENEFFDDMRASASYVTKTTPNCVDLMSSPNLYSAYSGTCVFTYPVPGNNDTITSKLFELKLDSFSDLNATTPSLRQVFQIP